MIKDLMDSQFFSFYNFIVWPPEIEIKREKELVEGPYIWNYKWRKKSESMSPLSCPPYHSSLCYRIMHDQLIKEKEIRNLLVMHVMR